MPAVRTSAAHPPASLADAGEIEALGARVAAAGGPGLSDQHRLAMRDDQPGRQVAVARSGGRMVAFAQLVAGNDAASLEVLIDPDPSSAGEDHVGLVAAVVTPLLERPGPPVHWWWSAPTDDQVAVARSFGPAGERRLLQMRRPVPTGLPVEVTTRDFRVGEDEATWVAVNNRAFAGHPEQGHWTLADVRSREREPWFDPAGFRIHERDGRMAAFCWTKLHQDLDPVLGEIYVIGVDPDFQGLGLGRQLTLAGLDSIAARGVEHGMLYVDESNTAAVGLYRALGFVVHHVDVAFVFLPGGADVDADAAEGSA